MSGLVHQSYKFYSKPINEIEESKRTKNKGNFAGISSNSGKFLYGGSGSGFLSFEDSEDQHYSGNMSPDQLVNLGSGSFDSLRLLENMSCVQSGSMNENQQHGELQSFAWPNDSSSDNYLATQESYLHKRTHSGETEQAFKKQCTTNTATKKSRQKSVVQPKDPQSIAAKNRRERISERLKVLQDLVPNGSKVDLVTMLEKAISYVKFLQLQVKVLATDEFWPVQDGKPPELSQVKDAIDAILSSSQRDRCSSSKTSSGCQ